MDRSVNHLISLSVTTVVEHLRGVISYYCSLSISPQASSSGISDENMDSLLTRLHTLSQAIQDLHPEASVSQIPTPLVTQASGPDHNAETDGS